MGELEDMTDWEAAKLRAAVAVLETAVERLEKRVTALEGISEVAQPGALDQKPLVDAISRVRLLPGNAGRLSQVAPIGSRVARSYRGPEEG